MVESTKSEYQQDQSDDQLRQQQGVQYVVARDAVAGKAQKHHSNAHQTSSAPSSKSARAPLDLNFAVGASIILWIVILILAVTIWRIAAI